jgi:hypothetical protein
MLKKVKCLVKVGVIYKIWGNRGEVDFLRKRVG